LLLHCKQLHIDPFALQGLSTMGADDAAAGDQDFARAPATKPGANEQAAAAEEHEQELMQRNARNNT
jgi:hypothetical protein